MLQQISHHSDMAMIGSSPAMVKLRQIIQRIACTSETVLVMGENGTGKELVARSLHVMSKRKEAAWVTLNCPALSTQLIESELFGHKKGAFTGADHDRIGRFEMASDGTLLLDEISEIDVTLQSKLLRVLQERTFERVGANETISADVRVIATTNRDLISEIKAGRFREDLYHRLAVLVIEVPPLRARCSDIPELVSHFSGRAASRLNQLPVSFGDDAIQLLCNYHWPGNVRQLENVVTRATLFADHGVIHADDVRGWLFEHSGMNVTQRNTPFLSNTQHHIEPSMMSPFSDSSLTHSPLPTLPLSASPNRLVFGKYSARKHMVTLEEKALPPTSGHMVTDQSSFPFVGLTIAEMEAILIEQTLAQFNGHRAKTAQTLGIGLRTLTSKIKQMQSS